MPKRKQKANVKPVNAFDKKVSELDKLVPFRTCYVCSRESRELQMIGPSKFRHEDCNPGSSNWGEYYEKLPKKLHTLAGELLLDNTKKGKTQ